VLSLVDGLIRHWLVDSSFRSRWALVVSGFAASFEQEFGVEDTHGFGDCFTHVVKGERGPHGTGEGFHFNAGARCGHTGAGDGDGVFTGVVGFDFNFTIFEWDWVAERDKIGSFFCCHSAGDDGGMKDRTFFALDIAIGKQRHDVDTNLDKALGGGDASGAVFG